ncbi:MAG TPA: YdeI/OmpD-associated family protein [Beijerinckiaceae bacterium]|jgi:uncharacterized protein YdeI (YjbR/CyaY-like superfamily)|nr:YdeI/OmpD-associated family protein [Beijerinckiaceae bacterium]
MNGKTPLVRLFADRRAFEAYLSDKAIDDSGCWLKLAKAGAPEPTISKAQAIEAALCHGWIDGQLKTHDQYYFLVRMTPRRRASRWSANNREAAERLIREGRMHPTGLREIEKAKADGRWDAAYPSQSRAEPSPEFRIALAANAKAERAFAALDSINRYAFIYRVNDAKRPETRADRIHRFIDMLAQGKTLHPRKSKATGKKSDE